MKIKGGWLTPNAVPASRHRVLIRDTKHGPVAQKWPAKRKRPPTEAELYARWQFAKAAQMASSPMSLELDTAIFMTTGTTEVPRDFLMACMYGRGYTIVNPDGTEWPVADHSFKPPEPPPEPTELPYTLVAEWSFAVSGAIAQLDVTGITNFNEVIVLFDGVTCATSGQRNVALSVNGGSSYFQTFGQYKNWASNGTQADAFPFQIFGTSSNLARYGAMWITGLQLGNGCIIGQSLNLGGGAVIFTGSTSPANALRVYAHSGGNMTGGKIKVLAR